MQLHYVATPVLRTKWCTTSSEREQKHILKDRRPSTTACPAFGTNELKQCTGRNKIFCTEPIRTAKAGQTLVYRHDWSNGPPTKEGPLSFVLNESPFASVSTVSRGHPSLVSLTRNYTNTPPPSPNKIYK